MPEVLNCARVSSDAPTGVINCAAYARGQRVADLPICDIHEALAHHDRFVWIGLNEPREEMLREVQREFNLHDLAIEDALSAHQRPKLELYDGSLFVVLRTAQLLPGGIGLEFGETHVFVGARYIVSVRHGVAQSYRPCAPAARRHRSSSARGRASCSTR